jgi:uncharacterized protein (DUF305 family)
LLFLSVTAFAQQDSAPIIQPGAPGQSSRTLSPESVATSPRAPLAVDVNFMQGMIMHHSQAVEMTAMMPSRTHNKALLELGQRITISQSDEITWMKLWLTDRGKPTTMDSPMGQMGPMAGMGAMGNMKMDPAPMLMPGMLTPEQMKALAAATGGKFDHLFLTGMIQHHGGALTMVQDHFAAGGAQQDPRMFDFATDIDNTQSAEIKIMQGMLVKEKK